MKRRWLYRLLVLLALAGFVVWLEPTRVAWGWLRGEAFFHGRPTSYWRHKCDEWMARFDDHDFFTLTTWLLPFEIPADPGLRRFGIPDDLPNVGGGMINPPPSMFRRFFESFRSKEEIKLEQDYYFAPRILWATPDTEPVLLELQREDRYRWLATIALRRVAEYRSVEAEVEQERRAARQSD